LACTDRIPEVEERAADLAPRITNPPVRGETFVTRKITRALARIVLGLEDCLYLGNLNARRDWGDARDFVNASPPPAPHPAPTRWSG